MSKEELEQLMGGHTAEEMAQWSPEELEAYLKRYEAILNKNRSDSMNKAQLGKIDHEGATVVEPEPGTSGGGGKWIWIILFRGSISNRGKTL